MSIVLSTYASGDTDYVSKMNNDNNVLTSAVNTLQAATAGAGGGTSTTLVSGMFGTSPALLGLGAYAPTFSGATLTLAAGAAWKPTTATVVSALTTSTVSLTGQPAGTITVYLDASGAPTISGSDAFFTVAWNGSAITSVTKTANVFLSAADEQALLHSTTNNTTYPTLLARLEAIETLLNTKV